MKKLNIFALVMVLLTGCMVTSCNSSEDVSEELSNDCVITSATLGTLKRIVNDTTTYSVTGGAYHLYIDQVKSRVFNPDSLPVGTCVDKLVFASNGIKCTGTLGIVNTETGKEESFTPTDSTDFSVVRKVVAYAPDGTSKRYYDFDIRVHKEYADELEWKLLSHNPLSPVASFVESRTLAVDGSIYVFGRAMDGEVKLVQTSRQSPSFDEAQLVAPVGGSAIDVHTIQYFAGHFFALAGGQLVTSTTAIGNWTSISATQHFNALVGQSTDSLYALAGNKMYASADGITWNESGVDTPTELPQGTDVAAATQQSRTDKQGEILLMVGSRQVTKADGTTADSVTVWKRDIDRSGEYSYPWINLPQTEELRKYACPLLKQVCLFAYDEGTVLTGINVANGTVAPFYMSNDNGRTWKNDLLSHLDTTGATSVSIAVDADHYIWVVLGGTGMVYRGRINRLGWN